MGTRERIILDNIILSQKITVRELARQFRIPFGEVGNMVERVRAKVQKGCKREDVRINSDTISLTQPITREKLLEMFGFDNFVKLFRMKNHGIDELLEEGDMVRPGDALYTTGWGKSYERDQKTGRRVCFVNRGEEKTDERSDEGEPVDERVEDWRGD